MLGGFQDFTEVKRRFSIAATDVNTGDYVVFNQTNTEFEELPLAGMSSSSIPIVFQPREFHNHFLMDGGIVMDMNPFSAVQQCYELVDDPADIIVDMVICGKYHGPEQLDDSANRAYANVQRS